MDSLAPLYRQMADEGENFHGLSIWQYRREIGELVKRHQAKRLLDFGCGRGDAYRHNYKVHRDWGLKWFDIKLYDPAFKEHSEMPRGKYDGVLCSDVLEHIPEEEVDAFVARLFGYARTFVWASVCCREAKKRFPDGRNLHVTVKPMAWWRTKMTEHAPENVLCYLTETP